MTTSTWPTCSSRALLSFTSKEIARVFLISQLSFLALSRVLQATITSTPESARIWMVGLVTKPAMKFVRMV